MESKRLKILTWHIHGSYLYYLSFVNCDFYIPVKDGRPERYGGLPEGNFTWGENMHEVDASEVKDLYFDCILFQTEENYLSDQFEILTEEQRLLPKVYLEHNPPRVSPVSTKHVVDDPDAVIVHVTHFNNIMWDNNRTPSAVIEHGVKVPKGLEYTGELQKGLVVVNNIDKRDRRLGLDVFRKVSESILLDIVGMGSERVGGLGEIGHKKLSSFAAKYRFFFNPIRYTSLGLAVCEAMMTGLPVLGLATTEMPQVVKNGETGFVSNDIDFLIENAKLLLKDRSYAQRLSLKAKEEAGKRFGIERFANEWGRLFTEVTRERNKTSRYDTELYIKHTQGGLI